jgi:hypothetical protein
MPLYGRTYTNDLVTPVFLDEFSSEIEDVTLVWGLHGGLQSVEVMLNCNYTKAYLYYRRFMGKRAIIDDHVGDRPVADGFITSAQMRRSGVTFTINGFWFRHSDQLYAFDDTELDTNQATDPGGAYNPVANSFQDYEPLATQQDFSEWESASSPAVYFIEVLNTDGSYSWGFLGAAFTTNLPNDSVYVYTDYDLTTPGWNETDPTDKIVDSYIIYVTYDYWTTSECIQEALTNEVPAISTNHNNIDDTETPVGRYSPPIEEGGMYPGEFIEKMASMSDSSNRQWNYWLLNANYENGLPQKPIPYFKAQTPGTGVYAYYEWNISSANAADDEIASREMFELRNSLRIIFRDMDADDLLTITDPATDADSIANYWLREAVISGGDNTIETAEYYRDLYLNDYKNPVMGLPITIAGPTIDDRYGRPCPLWYPIKYCKSYFRQVSLFPEYGLTSFNKDGTFTGQAMSMEYTYSDNTLRVVIDTESSELAAVLARIDAFS